MTPEELVDLGQRLEELERPNAEARKAEGQHRGGEVFAGREAWSSPEDKASRKHEAKTDIAVGSAAPSSQ